MEDIKYRFLNEEKRLNYYKNHANRHKSVGWEPLKKEQYKAFEHAVKNDEMVHCNDIDANVNLRICIIEGHYCDPNATWKWGADKDNFVKLDEPEFAMFAYIDKTPIAIMDFEPCAVGIRIDSCGIKKEYCDTLYTEKGIANLLCERIERLSQEMGVNRVFFEELWESDVGDISKYIFRKRGYKYEPEDSDGYIFAEKVLELLENTNANEDDDKTI